MCPNLFTVIRQLTYSELDLLLYVLLEFPSNFDQIKEANNWPGQYVIKYSKLDSLSIQL